MTLELLDAAPMTLDPLDSWVGVLESVANLAQRIGETEFVPKALRGNTAAITAAILHGRELGLPPMTALSQTAVIDGKPSLSAEGQRGLVLAAGHEIEFVETTGIRCTVRGRRAGSERWTAVTWTIDSAKSIGLANKAVWRNYPRAMLAARASAELCRLMFPDVLHGMAATEEIDDDAEPPAKRATTPVRRSARVAVAPPIPEAEQAPQTAVDAGWELPPPPAPSSPVKTSENKLPPDTDPAPTPPPVPVRPAQLKMLGVLWNRFGVTDDERRRYSADIVMRDLGGTTKNLTQPEAHGLINSLVDVLRPLVDNDDVMAENVDAADARAALEAWLERRGT